MPPVERPMPPRNSSFLLIPDAETSPVSRSHPLVRSIDLPFRHVVAPFLRRHKKRPQEELTRCRSALSTGPMANIVHARPICWSTIFLICSRLWTEQLFFAAAVWEVRTLRNRYHFPWRDKSGRIRMCQSPQTRRIVPVLKVSVRHSGSASTAETGCWIDVAGKVLRVSNPCRRVNGGHRQHQCAQLLLHGHRGATGEQKLNVVGI